MRSEELKKYYAIYTDVWKLFKNYSNMKDNEVEWELLAEECHLLSLKYNNTEFVRTIILATLNEIERIARK